MPNFQRPDGDISTGNWASTPDLFEKINDAIPNDTESIQSENDPANDIFEVSLTNLTDPAISTGHIVRIRMEKGQSGGGSPGTVNAIVDLYQTTTLIATNTFSAVANGLATFSFTLTGTEADNITDYNALRIRVDADKSAGARTSWLEVTGIEFETPSGTFTPEQTDWRWFQNDAIDPTTANAFAAENTKPTLPGDENYEVIRLRVLLQENGGLADATKVVGLEFSGDGGTTQILMPLNTEAEAHMYWDDGLAVNGNIIATTRLVNANTAGEYHEDASGTDSLAADETGLEIDFAIGSNAIMPDTDYDVRVIWDGTAVPVKSGSSVIQLRGSTAGSRSFNDGAGDILNTISLIDQPTDNEVRWLANGHHKQGFYDGARYWSFYMDSGDAGSPTLVQYRSTTSLTTAWSSEVTRSFTGIGDNDNFSVLFKDIGGTKYVLLVVADSATAWLFRRGTISAGTITWDGTERSFTAPHNADLGGTPNIGIAADDHFWFGAVGNTASNEIWMERSTNTLDNASYFTMSETALSASESGILGALPVPAVEMVPVNSADMLIVYYDNGNTNLRGRLVTTSSMGAATTVNASTHAHDTDWSIALDASAGVVYVMYLQAVAANSALGLRVYSISGDSWTTGTDPAHTAAGTTSDGLLGHMGDDGLFYTFLTVNGASGTSDTKVEYLKYTAGGDSGTWDADPTDLMASAKGNADSINLIYEDGGNAIVVLERGDDNIVGTLYVNEFYHLDTSAASTGPFPPGFRRRQLATVRM